MGIWSKIRWFARLINDLSMICRNKYFPVFLVLYAIIAYIVYCMQQYVAKKPSEGSIAAVLIFGLFGACGFFTLGFLVNLIYHMNLPDMRRPAVSPSRSIGFGWEETSSPGSQDPEDPNSFVPESMSAREMREYMERKYPLPQPVVAKRRKHAGEFQDIPQEAPKRLSQRQREDINMPETREWGRDSDLSKSPSVAIQMDALDDSGKRTMKDKPSDVNFGASTSRCPDVNEGASTSAHSEELMQRSIVQQGLPGQQKKALVHQPKRSKVPGKGGIDSGEKTMQDELSDVNVGARTRKRPDELLLHSANLPKSPEAKDTSLKSQPIQSSNIFAGQNIADSSPSAQDEGRIPKSGAGMPETALTQLQTTTERPITRQMTKSLRGQSEAEVDKDKKSQQKRKSKFGFPEERKAQFDASNEPPPASVTIERETSTKKTPKPGKELRSRTLEAKDSDDADIETKL